MLRSTAKDTIVNGKGVTSWLIRQSNPAAIKLMAVGPVPIMRPKDYLGQSVDNTASFLKLIEVRTRKFSLTYRPWSKEMRSRYSPKESRDTIQKLPRLKRELQGLPPTSRLEIRTTRTLN